MQTNYQLPHTIKANWTTYLVFTILFLPVVILWIGVLFKHPTSNAWQPVLMFLFILTLFQVWAASLKIILGKDKISYKTLFSRQKEILFSDVKKIEIAIGIGRTENEKTGGISYIKRRTGPFIRMNIYGGDRLLSINMKPFGEQNLIAIVKTISNANPNIQLDKRSLRLNQGDFRPVISGTISSLWQIFLSIFWMFLAISFYRNLLG